MQQRDWFVRATPFLHHSIITPFLLASSETADSIQVILFTFEAIHGFEPPYLKRVDSD